VIDIGPLRFATQKAAVEHFRAMLYRHGIGVTIPEPDATALRWLLVRHPYAAQKLGSGIVYFSTQYNSALGQQTSTGFVAIRADGSRTDFSYYTNPHIE
jgi:Protein of unknown function (DUF3223)